ncbi:DUF3667 domain-containing protein [Bizionia argentinensis JUB59]|uniref:DUF3667 domain-containing protein n=1 Tax=Bizionia argentinensis JUB59 TaxID=1046627 RepID=G2E9S0_9FLAO|nr:DUF3667 domain-containing protein [Bizionia argentinensis]EGV44789.1 DUF3667 domain-containing protein [Bizionia argentinensis JUB59]
MTNSKYTCKNCEVNFNKSFAFCPHCGQKRNDKLTIKVLFYNTISNYFSFDARFFKSFFPLIFRPGFLAIKFIEGKRLLCLHPAQMYLFVSLVFFFLFSFVEQDQAERLDANLIEAFQKNHSENSTKRPSQIVEVFKDSLNKGELRESNNRKQIRSNLKRIETDSSLANAELENFDINNFLSLERKLDSLIEIDAPNELIYKKMGMTDADGYFTKRAYAQSLKFYKSKKASSILMSFYSMIPIVMFFLLPIFALILKILHLKRGTYTHHLVFSFYYFSFLFTLLSAVIGISFIWRIPNWIDWLLVLCSVLYLLFALKNFYEQGWGKSILKWGITIFVFLAFIIPVTMSFLMIYSFLYH